MDGQSATLAKASFDDAQEWEICDIIGMEDVDGVLHYWVQGRATLEPKIWNGKVRALVAQLEHDSDHKVGKVVEKDEGGGINCGASR